MDDSTFDPLARAWPAAPAGPSVRGEARPHRANGDASHAGESRAVESLVIASASEFGPRLTLYARRILRGDRERARDVVQETFLRLQSHCRASPGDLASVREGLAEWLFTVCRRAAIDVLRKEKRMTLLNDIETEAPGSPVPMGDPPAPLRMAIERERNESILSALAKLPPDQQEVVRLKFLEGLSYAQISRVTGHSVANVGYLIHVAIKAIRLKINVAQGDA